MGIFLNLKFLILSKKFHNLVLTGIFLVKYTWPELGIYPNRIQRLPDMLREAKVRWDKLAISLLYSESERQTLLFLFWWCVVVRGCGRSMLSVTILWHSNIICYPVIFVNFGYFETCEVGVKSHALVTFYEQWRKIIKYCLQ